MCNVRINEIVAKKTVTMKTAKVDSGNIVTLVTLRLGA